jgi:hypothetical protein
MEWLSRNVLCRNTANEEGGARGCPIFAFFAKRRLHTQTETWDQPSTHLPQ